MDIYKMELHEILNIGDMQIIRVPGGWIYSICDYSYKTAEFGHSETMTRTSTFVRWDNEFLAV